MRWIERLEEATPGEGAPVVWLVRPDGEAAARALRTVRARPEDLAYAALWRDPERGAARLVRRLLLRALAGAVLDVAPDAVGAGRDGAGRPVISAPRALHASLARRDGWTAVAVAARPVGVDLECARPAAPLPLGALAAAERRQVLQAPDADGAAERFARMWTARESYLKATGAGLAGAADVAADLAADGVVRIEGPAGAAQAQTRRVGDLLACAVALG